MSFNKECWYYSCCKKADTRACTSACVRYLEMRTMLEKSQLPECWWETKQLIPHKDITAHKRLGEIKQNIDTWVDSGSNIYIYSPNYGNGKTSWAVKLLMAYFNRVWYGNSFRCKGLFVNSTRFLLRKKDLISKIDEEYLATSKTLETVNLAVWDDISACRLSEYDYQVLYSMLDTRLFNGKANIFTGNANRQQLSECLGHRLASRIWNTCEIIEFTNPDMRGVL